MTTLDIFDVSFKEKDVLSLVHKETKREFLYKPKKMDFSIQTIKSIFSKLINGDFSYILGFDNFEIYITLTLGNVRPKLYEFCCKEELLLEYPDDDIISMKREIKYLRYVVNKLNNKMTEILDSKCSNSYHSELDEY
jgi:hypothetical protein